MIDGLEGGDVFRQLFIPLWGRRVDLVTDNHIKEDRN